MAAPSGVAAWAEAALALTGALRLARGDRGALACFDATEDGFWRSFRAAVLCYPMFLLLLVFPVEIGTADEGHSWSYFIVETIRFVIAWTAFPLIVLPLAGWLGRGDRFLLFMTVYNWCQVPQTVAFTAVTLLGAVGALPPEASAARRPRRRHRLAGLRMVRGAGGAGDQRAAGGVGDPHRRDPRHRAEPRRQALY